LSDEPVSRSAWVHKEDRFRPACYTEIGPYSQQCTLFDGYFQTDRYFSSQLWHAIELFNLRESVQKPSAYCSSQL
jgi:hypothetical protein